jgi:hypothetical protein
MCTTTTKQVSVSVRAALLQDIVSTVTEIKSIADFVAQYDTLNVLYTFPGVSVLANAVLFVCFLEASLSSALCVHSKVV